MPEQQTKGVKVRLESSRIVKPAYKGGPPPSTGHVPLTVFDKYAYNSHVAVIYAFRPPVPPNSVIEEGLSVVLSEYREWAGRLGEDAAGDPVILLNDEGVKFIEASVESNLESVMPSKPTPAVLCLHPSLHGAEELVQVQLTRFSCGSLVLGFTAHHLVADGHASCNFLIAWGLATCGLPMDPLPLHDRTIFSPRDPPLIEFEHRGVEFLPKELCQDEDDPCMDDLVVHKVNFSKDFLSKLKTKASAGANRTFSTFESLVAHLWKVVTRVRGLSGREKTQVNISVNGRMRLRPRVPNEYFGNLVLWAFPNTTVNELLSQSLRFAAELIHDEVSKIDDDYFRSYIDFASSKAVETEGLVPTADYMKSVLAPNVEVESWLRFPFHDLDFGGGSPAYFMPTYFPVEGMVFLLPSVAGDGSIDALVPLAHQSLAFVKQACYTLD